MNCLQEFFRDEPSTLMTPFWPGIGKEQEEDGNGIWRKQMRDGIRAFDSKHTRVVQIFVCDFPRCAANATEKTFDTEKIALWILLRQRDEKRTIAAPKIYCEWSRVGKNRFQVEQLKIILRARTRP